ncbi:MAG: helix-turn-helix transcriptional regulator [Vicingaceae bacterium]|nr:helix-turn-helix transcriptional regulator [Vicingaceae bacterium]
MKIGSKLKSFRIEKGLNPVQVAEAIGVSESTYRRYEADKTYPDINVLDKMARLFEKPIADFFKDEIQENNQQPSNTSSIVQAYSSTVNQLSDKVIQMFEERINDLKKEVEYWKDEASKK